jgi:monooxygenase
MSAADVLVVGAGITGLAAGYHLGAHGIPYTILERGDDVGGVWRTHRWHGARCDSEIAKYSFSFRPFLSRRRLETAAGIHGYLGAVSREFGIRDRVRFDTAVRRAVFDPRAQRWMVDTSRGPFTGRFLVNGNGYFSAPHVPRLEGRDRFRGEIVHTAHLDGTRTFPDQRVVVVGSGATAICCAPALAAVSRSVVLLQRSPSYVYELPGNDIGVVTSACQALHRAGLGLPLRWLRGALQAKDDLVFLGLRRFPRLGRAFFRRHWIDVVGPAGLREHFRPRYDPWEQRIPVALGLKAAIRRGAVVLKTGHVDRFTESAIVLATGEAIPCDVCVLATGFEADLLGFDLSIGADRVNPAGLNFYKGMMLGGVPNYFHPFGVWHSAWTDRVEAVLRLAIEVIRHMDRRGFGTVTVERKAVGTAPRIMPNYVRRALPRLPRLHGSREIPTLDGFRALRFDPAQFVFA